MMSYLDDLEKMSVLDFLKQARHRIDGVVMYAVCSLFVLLSIYSVLAAYLDLPLPVPYWKGFWGAMLLVPITFFIYISFVYYSSPGKIYRLINATFLIGIPLYVAHKFNLF